MAYDETTLRNEVANANDGDIIEITDDIHLSGVISIDKSITIQSVNGSNFIIFKETVGRHFVLTSNVGSTLTLKNITLDGMNVGGYISVGVGGHLIMDAGVIVQNCYSSNGGAVSVGTGPGTSLIMKSGSITQNCSGELHGGGVYVGPNSTFTMEDGAIIRGCVTKEYGGGVYIAFGTFVMNGGEISDCRSAGGGGVCLYYLTGGPPMTNIIMNGGIITGCSAPFGGGILFENTTGVAAMNTVVTGNNSSSYGGGIGILSGSRANINTAMVSGNTAQLAEGSDAQIYILAEQSPYGGTTYSIISAKSSAISIALLDGEVRSLTFFEVRDDNTGESFVAFCGEPDTTIILNDFYLIYFLPNKQLARQMTDEIAITIRAALNGIRSYNVVAGDLELTIRAYVAQYVIWNIATGYYRSNELITTIDRIRAALGDSAADCLEEIVSAIRRYENRTLPSFAGSTPGSAGTCYLEYDNGDGKYKVTLTDTNGVLKYFKVAPDSLMSGLEIIFDHDNNTMTILCDDKSILKSGTVMIRLVSVLEDGDASVYFHPLYQDLVIPDNRYEITISAYIKPLIAAAPKKPCPCYAKTTKCRTSIEGQKIWIDNNNAGGMRPAYVEITLLRDGKAYKNLDMDSTGDGAFIFCCVPIGKNPRHQYNYQIDELDVPADYTKTIEGYNVINTLIP